jgi:hypothetical protein
MQAWTDERLNDLNKKVDAGFAEAKTEFRAVRGAIGALSRTIMAMWLTMIFGFAGIILGFAGVLLQHHL